MILKLIIVRRVIVFHSFIENIRKTRKFFKNLKCFIESLKFILKKRLMQQETSALHLIFTHFEKDNRNISFRKFDCRLYFMILIYLNESFRSKLYELE